MKIKKEELIKEVINLSVSGVLILLGIILMVYPWFGQSDPGKLLYLLFAIYGGIKIIEYIITKQKGDKEDLYTSIACILAAISTFKFASYNSPMVLSLTLASWIGIMSVIKLIKLDYYHDRKNGMLYVNLVTFVLFILLGLLTSINLYFDITVQTLMLGFFFVVNGLLNLSEDAIRIIVSSKTLKLKKSKK